MCWVCDSVTVPSARGDDTCDECQRENCIVNEQIVNAVSGHARRERRRRGRDVPVSSRSPLTSC